MKGSSSQKWLQRPRRTVESCDRIDIRTWHRYGLLTPGREFSWPLGLREGEDLSVSVEETHLVLKYCHAEFGDVRERISLEWTPCHYGGSRPWFLCPGGVNRRSCNQRVAVLYAVRHYFLCRHCHGLAYRSQQVDPARRLRSKTRKIFRRLGETGNVSVSPPSKPKRMHWRTYERLLGQALATTRTLLSTKVKKLPQKPKRTHHLADRVSRLLN